MDPIQHVSDTFKEEVHSVLQGYNWDKAKLAGTFTTGGYGFGLTYIDQNGVEDAAWYEELKENKKLYKCVKRLVSQSALSHIIYNYFLQCLDEGKQWNEATFILDRQGNVEHSFVMNWQKVFQDKIESIHTAASGLAERVYECLSNVLPDDTVWADGSVTLSVRDSNVTASYTINIASVPQTQTLNLDNRERKIWLQYYNWVDSGDLKGHFPAWDTIQIELPFVESDFSDEKHVAYRVQ